MLRKAIYACVTSAVLVGSAPPVVADDAEIYLGEAPGSEPLIMFSLDYRPNLGATVCGGGDADACAALFAAAGMSDDELYADGKITFFELLRAALKIVMEDVNGVRVGLMLNHDNVNNCAGQEDELGCSNGGYIALDFVEFDSKVPETSTKNKKLFNDVLASIPIPGGNQSHPYQGRELFYEFYRYMKGMPVFNGHVGYTSYDQSGNPKVGDNNKNLNIDPDHVEQWQNNAELVKRQGFAWDPSAETAPGSGIYSSPLKRGDLSACSKIYTVNLMFFVVNQDADSDAEIKRTIPTLPSSIEKAKKGGKDDEDTNAKPDFEEMISHLNQTGVGDLPGSHRVTSYFFVDPNFINNTTDGYARLGGTNVARPLSTNPDELVKSLSGLFDEILSVSTTFTSAALPINSFDRSELRPDVFLALFQPQLEYLAKNKYWWGNVKKLRLEGLDTPSESAVLVDSRLDNAVDGDGRLKPSALTFWTVATAPDIDDLAETILRDKDGREDHDGRSVNRGGSGHRIPGHPQSYANTGPRTLYFDFGSDLAPLTTVNASSVSLDFGVSDEQAATLIGYLDGSQQIPALPFKWLTGSVMHSRPVPINYGLAGGHTDPDNPLVYIAFGSNDGAFRFVRNTRPGDATGSPRNTAIHTGTESWAFVPREVMPTIRKIFLGTESEIEVGESTLYGVDGAPTVWLEDIAGDGTIDGDDKAYVFFGLRRGGKAYYALDVSNPESPKLMWKVDSTTPGFGNLGLTFSQPAVGKVDLGGALGVRLVLIVGGGYDRAYDAARNEVPSDVEGNAIYVIDALTGARLETLTRDGAMLDSIPSSVTAVDMDGDVRGLLDRLYVGDLGGNVWRVDIPVGQPASNWPLTRLAALGRRAPSPADPALYGPDDRRFFHRPDVVKANAFYGPNGEVLSDGFFDAVIIGSGDRANPNDPGVDNFMFMLRDYATGILPPAPAPAVDTDITYEKLFDVTGVTGAAALVGLEGELGWALQLEVAGEKSLASPLTISNTVFFTTFLPKLPQDAPDPELAACQPDEGSGRFYAVSLQNANPFVARDRPIDNWAEGEPFQRYTLLNSGGIPAEVVAIPPNRILRPDLTVEPVPATSRWRTFWRLDELPTN